MIARGAMQPSTPSRDVLGNADIVVLILTHTQLSPMSFAAYSRVCRAWRIACRTDERLLTSAALAKPLTKRAFMDLFALSSAEADALPRGMRARIPSGFMYMYEAPAVREAMPLLGGLVGWRGRVERRGRRESTKTCRQAIEGARGASPVWMYTQSAKRQCFWAG